MLRQALQIFKQQGNSHPDYATSLNNLAGIYQELGRYEEALSLARQALQLRQKLGDSHPDYGSSLNSLASLYQDMGRYEQALRLYQQALKIRKQFGDNKNDESKIHALDHAVACRFRGVHSRDDDSWCLACPTASDAAAGEQKRI